MLGKQIFPLNLMPHLTIDDLVNMFGDSRAYNAGRLYEACRLYEKMLDEDATIALTLAGAMAPAGMGGPIIKLMEYGFIDFIVSTGANLYHDLHFALDLSIYQGDFRANDVQLRERGIVRIYDIFIPEEALLKTDKFLGDVFLSSRSSKPLSTAELHRMIGGGSPKNFYLQTQPQLLQILGVGGGGQDFLIRARIVGKSQST
jgi:deoxyhypusine synthase